MHRFVTRSALAVLGTCASACSADVPPADVGEVESAVEATTCAVAADGEGGELPDWPEQIRDLIYQAEQISEQIWLTTGSAETGGCTRIPIQICIDNAKAMLEAEWVRCWPNVLPEFMAFFELQASCAEAIAEGSMCMAQWTWDQCKPPRYCLDQDLELICGITGTTIDLACAGDPPIYPDLCDWAWSLQAAACGI